MLDTELKLKAIIHMAMSVLPKEMGCDDCVEFLAAYAEHLLRGTPVPGELAPIGEHIHRCFTCAEELEYLLEALKIQEFNQR